MNIPKPVILVLFFLLVGAPVRAQSRPADAPTSTQQEVTVSITLPTVVAQLSDFAQTVLSRNKGPRKTLTGKGSRTSNPVVEFTVELPKGWGSKKSQTRNEKK
jgi:hypothetical protein